MTLAPAYPEECLTMSSGRTIMQSGKVTKITVFYTINTPVSSVFEWNLVWLLISF